MQGGYFGDRYDQNYCYKEAFARRQLKGAGEIRKSAKQYTDENAIDIHKPAAALLRAYVFHLL